LSFDNSGLESLNKFHIALLDSEILGEIAFDLGEKGQVLKAILMKKDMKNGDLINFDGLYNLELVKDHVPEI
jgi:hypothetical protein